MSLAGTAIEDATTIVNVTAHYRTGGSWLDKDAVPSDGLFNSANEDFTIFLANLQTGPYEIQVIVTNSEGLYNTYVFTGSVEGNPPSIEVENLGLEPMEDNTPSYTGTAIDGETEVVNVEYSVFDPSYPPDGVEVDWTSAVADDGAFDSPIENFHFEVSPALVDGVKFIVVRATDASGNITHDVGAPDQGFQVDKIIIDAVDSAAPIVQVQDVIPNPIRDPEPYLQGKIRDSEEEKSSLLAHMYYRVDGGSWAELNALDGNVDEIEEEFSTRLTGFALGSHTVDVRAIDASGNDTDLDNINGTITFEMIAQEESNSTKLTKEENFDTHNDEDIIATDLIWGNGRLRLKEEMNPVGFPIITSGFMPRYGYVANAVGLAESSTNGFWVSKIAGRFSYYDLSTNTEYEYNLSMYWPWNDITRGMEEIYVGGHYYLWVTAGNGVLGMDFGSSITDGLDAYVTYFGGGATNTVVIDRRNGSDYGIWFNTLSGGGALTYFKPNDFTNLLDNEVVVYTNADGYPVDNITSLYQDPDTGYLWIADYEDGITLLNDNNTPLNKGDDTFETFSEYFNVFDFGKDKNGHIFFGGNRGLEMQLDDGGTPFDESDDYFIMLASGNDLGIDVVAAITYHEGVYPVGSQFFISTRSGDVKYLSINDTYEDKLDDQIITLPLSEGQYPNTVGNMQMIDYDTLLVVSDRRGVYEFDLNRDFVSSGFAMTEVDAQIEGRLDVDFITLEDVGILLNQGGISYEVSNDGGLTWVPINLGGTVNFPGNDYRIKFRINMTKGSTPVIGSYRLVYSAYQSADLRELNLDIEDEPPEVHRGDPFSFTVEAFDELFNPYDEDTLVTLQLRKVSDNSVATSFNIPNTIVQEGESFVDDASADVVGLYYIYGWSDSVIAVSDPINFVDDTPDEPSIPITPLPYLALGADRYLVNPGDVVTLSWNSLYLDNLTLRSDFGEFGQVSTAGTRDVIINEKTAFYLTGTGPYGSLARSVTIDIIPAEEVEGKPPEIIVFDIDQEKFDETYDRLTISWKVLYVDRVSITGVGGNLSPEGTAQIFITEASEFTIFAQNEYGEASQTKGVGFHRGISELMYTGNGQNIIPSLLPLVFALGVLVGASLLTANGFGSLMTFISGFFLRLGLLIGVRLSKKKKYWGFVYDEIENKGIPFAIVRVFEGNKFIAQTVADIDGKYGIALERPGSFTLHAFANGFLEYTKDINLSRVGKDVEVVEDIPMTQLDKQVSALKQFMRYSKPEMIRAVKVLLIVLMLCGFVYTVFVTYQYPILFNGILVIIYLFLFALNAITYMRWMRGVIGHVLDKQTTVGISGVSVRVYENEKQRDVYLTNEKGIAKMNLKPGDYMAIVHKPGYMPAGKIIKSAIVGDFPGFVELNVLKQGYLKEDIYMKKR